MADRWKSSYPPSDAELQERIECVRKAIWFAIARAPSTIYQTTGHELSSIAKALIPGLLGFLGILVASTATGAFLGASVGVLFFGLGVAPGAYAGAAGGFNVGVSILNYLGLGFLAAYIGGSFYQASFMARLGLKEAWEAPEDKAWQQSTHVFSASQKLSEAIALVFAGILQGVVAFILAKGTANAAKRVPELVGKLRESKLGIGFAAWVEANWKTMIENPRLGGIKSGAHDGSAPFPKELEPLPFLKRETRPLSEATASRDFEGNLRGKKVKLQGVKEREIMYTKRSPQETAKLRSQFNSTEKKRFLQDISTNPKKMSELRKAGFTETEIKKMQLGKIPRDGWDVHHKLPLDDGGTNTMDNLILMKRSPYHQTLTTTQNALTKGMQAGETRVIKFPVPNGFVYPTP